MTSSRTQSDRSLPIFRLEISGMEFYRRFKNEAAARKYADRVFRLLPHVRRWMPVEVQHRVDVYLPRRATRGAPIHVYCIKRSRN